MKVPQTKQEKELLEVLDDVISQACYVSNDNGYYLDSMALSSYAWGMRILAEYGCIEITSELGRRVISADVVTDTSTKEMTNE